MYKMVGADNREYGPVPADKVREWIAQGRANGQTLVNFEGGPWKPLSTFPEFADFLRTATPPTLAQTPYGTAYGAGYAPKTNSMAVAGLVFGILGFFCCGPLGAILAIIFGAIGLSQMNKSPELYSTPRAIPYTAIALGIVDLIVVFFIYQSGLMERIMRDMKY